MIISIILPMMLFYTRRLKQYSSYIKLWSIVKPSMLFSFSMVILAIMTFKNCLLILISDKSLSIKTVQAARFLLISRIGQFLKSSSNIFKSQNWAKIHELSWWLPLPKAFQIFWVISNDPGSVFERIIVVKNEVIINFWRSKFSLFLPASSIIRTKNLRYSGEKRIDSMLYSKFYLSIMFITSLYISMLVKEFPWLITSSWTEFIF